MKKLLVACCLLISVCCYGQDTDWQWARSAQFGTPGGFAESMSIAIDPWGNVSATGWYNGDYMVFGDDTLYHNGTNPNVTNYFVVKYNSAGNLLWFKGGGDPAFGRCVAANEIGDIFVAGYFSSDSIQFGNITVYNSFPGFQDIFIVKYNAFGNAVWAKSAGGNSTDQLNGITTDNDGNIILVGNFLSSDIAFDLVTLNHSVGFDIFLAKYDTNGNVLWAKSAGGDGAEEGNSLAVDATNNIYITGVFESSSIMFGNYTLTGGRFYLAKYDASGEVTWARDVEGQIYSQSVAADNDGNAFVTGYYHEPCVFGADTLPDPNNSDIFLAKYSSTGTALWARSAGGNSADRGWCVSTDTSGNAYIAAEFLSSSIQFGSAILTAPPASCPPPYGCDPACVAKYNSSGDVICAIPLATGGDDILAIVNDESGNIYLGGDSKANPFILGIDTMPLIGEGEGFFVAKFTLECDNELSVNIESNNLICNDECSGSASVNAYLGTAPYTYLWSNSETTATITGLCAGNYTVTVTDADGNMVNASVAIIDGINIPLTILQNGDTLFAIIAPNYQWYLNDTLIPGANDQIYVIEESGYYYVITSTEGCSFTSNTIETSCQCVGIDENELGGNILLYPNPTKGTIIIRSDYILENTELKMFNSLGQQVFSPLIEKIGLRAILYVSHLPVGSYYLSIINGKHSVSKQFIKE